MSKNLRAWLVMLALVAILVAGFRFSWVSGRKAVVKDLVMEGYRMVVTRECEVGEGRYTIQVWRGSWVDVER